MQDDGNEEGSKLSASKETKILIKGGIVVNSHLVEVADVYIENGKISEVGPNLTKAGCDVRVIQARGKYVMPGGIDPHTHISLDFSGTASIDDYLSGQCAALAGGTTMNMDFVMPTKESYIEGVKTYFKKAELAVMDYGFHAQIIFWNKNVADELEVLVKHYGINSFKFFQALEFKIRDDEMIEGFEKCKSLGAVAMVHAENGDAATDAQQRMIKLGITGVKGHPLSRPPFVEEEGVGRAISLARGLNVPLYVVHVMSRDAMEQIAEARKLGQRVIGQPIIASLALDNRWYWHPDFDTAAKYVLSPPISPPGHDKAIQAALSRGILQLVGTDHCPYSSTQRRAGINDFRKIPNGVNGIEERMHILWDSMVASIFTTMSTFNLNMLIHDFYSSRILICFILPLLIYLRTLAKLVSWIMLESPVLNAAKIFNIYPRKGAILPGSDADVIILNPEATFHISAKTHHSRSDVNIFEGMSGKGKIETTIAGGRVVWENDKLSVTPGTGRYVAMPPYGYLYEGIDKQDAAYIASIASSHPVPPPIFF
ncbi:hypothetical protein QQ045_024994 [Rhodiola kirilowii]